MKIFKENTVQLSDEELMIQVMDRHSHPALIELHSRYSRKLLGYFIKMLNKDEDLAQDFVQDLFLKLMEKKHLYDPEKKFYTWVFTIARNMCKTAYRNPFLQRISEDEFELNHKASLGDNLAEKAYFNLLLQKSLNNLEEHHKTTFVLRYMENFSLQEIAEITEASLGTVKSRLFYATQKMAKELKEYNPKYETNLFKLS